MPSSALTFQRVHVIIVRNVTGDNDELHTIVTDHVPSSLSDGPGPDNCGTQVAQPWPNNLADLEEVSLLLHKPGRDCSLWQYCCSVVHDHASCACRHTDALQRTCHSWARTLRVTLPMAEAMAVSRAEVVVWAAAAV